MKKRAISAVFMLLILGIFLGLRFLKVSAFDFVILVMNLIGSYEVSKCFTESGRKNNYYVALFFVVFSYLGLNIGFSYNIKFCYSLLILIGVLFISIISMFFLNGIIKKEYESSDSKKITQKEFKKKYYLNTLFVLIYPCLLLSSMYYINELSYIGIDVLKDKADLGLYVLLSVFSISMATDTFAYLVGRKLKGPKLAPKISPNKTISGAIGGLVFGMLSSVALYLIFMQFNSYNELFTILNLNVYHALMIGMLGSIFDQVGDLIESQIKRKIGVKDFGNLFPGHGGIMDRIDGLSVVSFVILLIYLVALAF